MSKIFTAVGLMSGTSMDGIDAAVIRTDGEGRVERGLAELSQPYEEDERQRLRAALGAAVAAYDELAADQRAPLPARQQAVRQRLAAIERELTDRHAAAVEALLREAGLAPSEVDFIGLHGHTVLHRPAGGFTLQLGDGPALRARLGIPVVSDFRSCDVAAGGQGAPLVPVYHQALARAAGLDLPVAVVNVGGIANVTFVGARGELIAFDTGPGNCLIDDWMLRHAGVPLDDRGWCAAGGFVVERALAQLLDHPYFDQAPPKSLDRNDFGFDAVASLSLQQGAATLTAFTALAVTKADFFFPTPPKQWIICGGGTRNDTMMKEFARRLDQVSTADELGWSSEFMEAEAFAYLAVRASRGLPITFPDTTGTHAPQPCGTPH